MPLIKQYGEMKGVNKYKEMNNNRFRKGLNVLQREGILAFAYRTGHYLKRLALSQISPLIIACWPKSCFLYQGKPLPYFLHKKSLTWTNERAIEVPIAYSYVLNSSSALNIDNAPALNSDNTLNSGNNTTKRILEVGAVLYHYYPNLKKDVLDKFESGPGIINEDAIIYQPKKKYDLIISISTLEHVGYDDNVKDPEGTLKAIQNLKNHCLNVGGKMVITLPISYNQNVDRLLFAGKLKFDEEYYFKRISLFNQWKETTKEEAKTATYNHHAETIVVGIINR